MKIIKKCQVENPKKGVKLKTLSGEDLTIKVKVYRSGPCEKRFAPKKPERLREPLR